MEDADKKEKQKRKSNERIGKVLKEVCMREKRGRKKWKE